MRVLILPDADFLTRERTMLQRLEIGIADEGARVIHAMTASTADAMPTESVGVYSTQVTYHDIGLPFTFGLRVTAFMKALENAAPVDTGEAGAPRERAVDVVHILGEAAWPFGLEICRRTGASALIEVWQPGLIAKAAALCKRAGAPGSSAVRSREPRMTFLAPSESLDKQLTLNGLSGRTIFVPWGVHPADAERGPIDPAQSLTVALLASGRDPEAVHTAIKALVQVAAHAPGLMVFVDSQVAAKLPVWKWAGCVGTASATGPLAERISVIADLEGRRDLTLQADVLLVPEALGEHRTLVLDAMASGMLVVARADPVIDYLSDPGIAALTHASTADACARAIIALVQDPARCAEQRAAAWKLIDSRRSASNHVRALLAACDAAARTSGAPAPGGV